MTVLKGAVVGNGSMVGAGAVILKRGTAQENCVYSGFPAKKKRTGITWRAKGSLRMKEEDVLSGRFDVLQDDQYIYSRQSTKSAQKQFESIVLNQTDALNIISNMKQAFNRR